MHMRLSALKINRVTRVLTVFLSLAFGVFSTMPASALGDGGSGASSDPYRISSCSELQAIDGASSSGMYYRLTNDIDCTATATWNLSGGSYQGFAPITGFQGVLDGGGHAILGLHINRPTTSHVGIFADTENATIENLSVDSSSHYISDSDTGTFVGVATNTQLTNVHSAATVDGGDLTGGLVGQMSGTIGNTSMIISKSNFTGIVYAANYGSVGGIAGGTASDWKITDSFSNASVSGGVSGGLIGYTVDMCGTLTNSYAAGTVTSLNNLTAGGLVGDSYYACTGSPNLVITNSFAAPSITTTNTDGGIFGYADDLPLSIANTYFDMSATSAGHCFGIRDIGFVHQSTDQSGCSSYNSSATPSLLKGNKTDTPISSWDFMNTWKTVSNGFPVLSHDGDSDGIPDSVEALAPNNGDANNDGIKDQYQDYIASYVDSVSNKYAVLQVPSTCMIQSVTSAGVSANAKGDGTSTYPAGMMNFTISCNSIGATVTVRQYYYGMASANLVARKYNPSTKTYQTIPGAVFTQMTIGGQAVTEMSYTVTDGGSFDADGTANGIIIDPAGPALTGAPDTGFGTVPSNTNATLLLTASALLIATGAIGLRKRNLRSLF